VNDGDDEDEDDDHDDDDDDDDVMSFHGYGKYFGNSGLTVKCDNGPCSNLYP